MDLLVTACGKTSGVMVSAQILAMEHGDWQYQVILRSVCYQEMAYPSWLGKGWVQHQPWRVERQGGSLQQLERKRNPGKQRGNNVMTVQPKP